MTAEKIAHTNTSTGIRSNNNADAGKQGKNPSDIFSRHLDTKLDRVDTGSIKSNTTEQLATKTEKNPIANSRAAQQNEDIRQAKIDQSERTQDHRLEQQRQKEIRTEEKRLEQQRKEERAEARANERLKQSRQTEITSTDNKSPDENSEVSTKTTDENTVTSSEENKDTSSTTATQGESEHIKEETPETELANADPLNEEQSLNDTPDGTPIAGELQLEDTTPAGQHQPDEIETSVIAAQTLAAHQPAETTTTDKSLQNNQLSGTGVVSKATEPLESNLGQPDHGEQKQQKGNGAEKDLNQLAASQKAATQAKDAVQIQPPQNQGPAPILASTQLNDASFKGQLAKTGFDASQLQTIDKTDASTSLSNSTEAKSTSPASQLHARGYTSPTQAVAIQIAAKAQNGTQQFEIRLNPPELGRVEVKMEFGRDGQINTHLIVERPETLDMLSKDARQLERALAQAGVNLESDGLTFSLKDQGDNNGEGKTGNDDLKDNSQHQANDSDLEQQIDQNSAIYRQLTNPSGLDISV